MVQSIQLNTNASVIGEGENHDCSSEGSNVNDEDIQVNENDAEDDFDDDDAPASARGHVAHIVIDISRKHTREKLVALAAVSAITIGIIRHRGRVQKASAHDPWR